MKPSVLSNCSSSLSTQRFSPQQHFADIFGSCNDIHKYSKINSLSFNTYRVSSNANTVNTTFGSAIVGNHWLGVHMHIFTALAKVLLYFSSENGSKKCQEKPKQFVEV